jgi:transposase
MIPVKMSREHFEKYADPFLIKAKRGFVCMICLYKVFNYILYCLHTGCQWYMIPIDKAPDNADRPEISWQAVYYHFRKWCKDGSFRRVWENSILSAGDSPDLSLPNFDGTQTVAKKGGESVAYQGRKKAKTSNILPVTDKNGYPVACTDIMPGNHNDAYRLENNLKDIFRDMKQRKLPVSGAYFNADSCFDTENARKVCFNYGLIPNIPENRRSRKYPKRGRKRLFNQEIYKIRFGTERTFAWIDKFRRLLIRFERKDVYFKGFHFIAFALICLRNLIN